MKTAIGILTHARPEKFQRALWSAIYQEPDAIYVCFAGQRYELTEKLNESFEEIEGYGPWIGRSRASIANHAFRDGCHALIELDDDDVMLNGAYERMKGALGRVDVVYGDFVVHTDHEQKTIEKPEYERGLFKSGCHSNGVRGYTIAAYLRAGKHNKFLKLCSDFDLFLRFDMDEDTELLRVPDGPLAVVGVEGDNLSVEQWPEQMSVGQALVRAYYPEEVKA